MKALDMAYCIGERHSLHLVRDNAGSLIALSAPLCRSGWMQYRGEELGVGGNELVNVYRSPETVLDPAHLASIEGKVCTLGHPSEFVTPANSGYYAKGHVQNVRRGPDVGDEVQIIGDVHITDQQAIDRVANGERDLSLGYYYELDEGPRAGTYAQRNLRANHCAIVPAGRAGTAKIIDRAITSVTENFEALVQRFHRRNATDVSKGFIESENKESPLLKALTTDEDQIETEEPMNNKEILDALQATNTEMRRMFDALLEMKNAKAKDGDGCNCGGKKTHSDACPMYTEQSEDLAPVDLIPANSNGGGEGNTNPTARDCETALNHLRGIRHIVADSGDLKVINAYNNAVKDIKRKLADALMRGPERVGPDPTRQAMDDARSSGEDFEEMAGNFHRAEIPKDPAELSEIAKKRPAKAAVRRFGVDARSNQREIAEDFEDSIKAARDKALTKK